MDAVVLVPVKAFRDAKARLSGVLDAPSRARLSRWTAARVIAAAGELPVYVVCDDDEVATWAGAHGATVLWHPGEGLNGSVNSSIAALRDRRVSHVVIAHGDLPRPAPLAALVTPGMITLVPDRRDDGTNVAAVPTASGFELSYGPGSFRRHVDAAMALGLPLQVCRHPTLSLDIDTPADLLHPLVLEVLPEWLRTNPGNHLQP